MQLADLQADPGERTNLAAAEPESTAEPRATAEGWREGIERHLAAEWAPRMVGPVSYAH